MGHGGQAEPRERNPLHRLVGGVLDDLVDALSPRIPRSQDRRVAVGLGGQGIELVARHAPHLGEMRTSALELGRAEHGRAHELEVGIGRIEVEPSRRGHRVGSGLGARHGRGHMAPPTIAPPAPGVRQAIAVGAGGI